MNQVMDKPMLVQLALDFPWVLFMALLVCLRSRIPPILHSNNQFQFKLFINAFLDFLEGSMGFCTWLYALAPLEGIDALVS